MTRNAGAAAAGVLLLASLSCGKKGGLRPPEPRGPLAPSDVSARQDGPRITVAFTVPRPRGEKNSQRPAVAELVRLEHSPGTPPPLDAEAFRRARLVAVVQGETLEPGARLTFQDSSWTATEGGGVGWTFRYAVRVRDRTDRPSPLVVAPDLVPVFPLPPPAGLRAEAVAEGVRLEWQTSQDATPLFNLYRAPAGMPFGERPLNADPLTSTEYLDAAVETGRTYRYVVRTSASKGPSYRESDPAGPVEIVAEDRFPPAAPTGLVVVQEGSAVRLFWNPNPERDLGGYQVERRLGSGSSFERIHSNVVAEPFYLDASVDAGAHAAYRVAAVDRAGNSGPPSEASEIDIAADPAASGAR